MDALRELWLLIRVKQAALSIAYYQRDIERSRIGLDRAMRAYEQAKGDLDAYDMEPTPEPPAFLRKKDDDGERTGAAAMGAGECGHGVSVALPTTRGPIHHRYTGRVVWYPWPGRLDRVEIDP